MSLRSMTRTATITDEQTQFARIRDVSAKHLSVGHLRAFLEEVDKLGFPEDQRVTVTTHRQESDAWVTVDITATRSDRKTRDAVTDEAN